jgi:hypothetical protein
MSALKDFNLRDKGAAVWAGWSRPVRTAFVIIVVVLIGLHCTDGTLGKHFRSEWAWR